MNGFMKIWMGFVFLAASFSGQIFAAVGGGDEAGNGAGIAEHHVVSAYLNLGEYLDLCLNSSECELDAREHALLRKIRTGLLGEYQNRRQLSFKKESELPGFFIIDGYLRVAKTGDQVGSTIYVNRDLLYRMGPGGVITGLSLESAIAILVHEMGHHHGEVDHTVLDYLGAKVMNMVLGVLQRTDLGPNRRNILATVFDLDRAGSFAQFLVSDGLRAIDLSAVLKSFIQCPSLNDEVQTLQGLSLFNLHWKWKEGDPLSLRGDLVLFCENAQSENASVVRGYGIEVNLAYRWDSQSRMRLQPGSESFKQVLCAENPSVCSENVQASSFK